MQVKSSSKIAAAIRAIGGYEKSGVQTVMRGHNRSPLVEVGLTDLLKSGGTLASPAPPGTTGLAMTQTMYILQKQDLYTDTYLHVLNKHSAV